ncbi:hypothetical protein G6F23_013297 [Rhizopus arrhizus]|nr:hypothetical protein G6F23_013297 [Rhizopus arrhizus]
MPAISPNSTPPMMTLWKCAIRNRLLCRAKSAGGTASSTPVMPPITKPVEDLGAGRDRDDHRRDPEKRVHAGAGPHGEEVVQPDQAFAAEGGHHFGEDAEGGQDQDVDLRVAPDPDQVHVHHGVAAEVRREEVGANVAVHGQQGQHRGRHGEGGHDQHVGAQRGPGEDGHAHHGHAGRAHLHDGDQQVDAG